MFTVQVPVLKDGDFVLTESVAMLRYLAREKQVEFTFHVPGPTHLDLEVQLMSPGTSQPDYFGFHQVADHWYPKESQAQARVDEYLEWQHLGTRSIFESAPLSTCSYLIQLLFLQVPLCQLLY